MYDKKNCLDIVAAPEQIFIVWKNMKIIFMDICLIVLEC